MRRNCLHGILACALVLPEVSAQDAGGSGTIAQSLARWDAESQRLATRIASVEAEFATLARIPLEQTGERLGYHSRIQQGSPEPLWVQVDLGVSAVFDTVVVVPVVLPKEQGGIEGYGFPEGFRVEATESMDFSAPILLADFAKDSMANPGRTPIIISCPEGKGRYLRLTATAPAGRRNGGGQIIWPSLALAEIMVLRGDVNLAAGRTVTAPTSREAHPVWSLQNLTDSESIIGPPTASTIILRKGWHSIAYADAATPEHVILDLGKPLPLQDVRLFPMRWQGFPHWIGFGFPVRFRVECSMEESFSQSHVISDHTKADFPNPGVNAVVMPADGVSARYVRITSTRLWERFTDHAIALAEVQVFSGDRNVAREAKVTATSVYPDKPWFTQNLVDGDASDNPILPLPEWLAQLQKSVVLEREHAALQAQRTARLAWLHDLAWRVGIALAALALALPTVFLIRNSVRRLRELRQLRERIARDLHDEVGSNLAGIALLSREAAKAPEHQRVALLEEIREVAEETSGSMRDLVWMIQPGAPGDLIAGLRTLAERMLKGLRVTFRPPATPWRGTLTLDAKRDLYLMCKEVLQNIVKHSAATEVSIAVQPEGRTLALRIHDNGKGFDPASATSGFGLPNLRERAKRLGGTCDIASSPASGTTVSVKAPLA